MCSNCADRLRSRVTAVQPSSSTFTSGRPALTIGSMVKNMPGRSTGPSPRLPKCSTLGAAWKVRPMPWPQKSRTTLKRLASTKVWMAWPTSPSVAPGTTAATPCISD